MRTLSSALFIFAATATAANVLAQQSSVSPPKVQLGSTTIVGVGYDSLGQDFFGGQLSYHLGVQWSTDFFEKVYHTPNLHLETFVFSRPHC